MLDFKKQVQHRCGFLARCFPSATRQRLNRLPKLLGVGLFFLFYGVLAQASTEQSTWFTHDAGAVHLNVDFFLSSTCSHCQRADAFWRDFSAKNTWINVRRYVVDEDKAALQSLAERIKENKILNYSVPVVFFCDAYWFGFDNQENSGKFLQEQLTYCREKIQEKSQLTASTVNTLHQRALAHEYQINQDEGVELGIALLAFMDALTLCSLFSLMALIAFVRWGGTTRSAWGVGLAYIVGLLLMRLINLMGGMSLDAWFGVRGTGVLIGAGLLWCAGKQLYLMKPQSEVIKKPVLYMLAVVAAVVVQGYQQACTPDFMSITFFNWLETHVRDSVLYWGYCAAYLMLYAVPFLLFLLIDWILVRYLWSHKVKRHFASQTSASISLSVIGGMLIVYPVALSNASHSVITLIGTFLLGRVIAWRACKP